MIEQVRSGLGRVVLALGMCAALALPAGAQPLTTAQRDAAIEFTLNNTHHVLLHEIGHLFVDQFELPVLGKEEDAVDALATLAILDADGRAALQVLADTVDGWQYSERNRSVRGYLNADFYGSHSLDIQRSFAIACLMVGSDIDGFTGFATRVGLPIDRQQTCAEDFRLASQSWTRLLEPHFRTSDFGAEVTVVYREHDARFAEIAEILKDNRMLERAADWIVKTHVLPNPVQITAEECGVVNAFYYPGDRSIILCYEWAEFFFDMFVTDILPEREHFAEMRKLKTEKVGVN